MLGFIKKAPVPFLSAIALLSSLFFLFSIIETKAASFQPASASLILTTGNVSPLPSSCIHPVMMCYSSDPSVLSVSDRGILQAKREGEADVLYGRDGVLSILKVTVIDPYTGTKSVPKTTEVSFEVEEPLLFMEEGDSHSITLNDSAGRPVPNRSVFSWSSSDTAVVKVSSLGEITARKRGSAVVTCRIGASCKSVYVNVITRDYVGKACDFTMLTADGTPRTYRMFKQNAHNYPKYDSYLAWHGCATCSLATVLGAYHPAYHGILPSAIIDGVEKGNVPPSAWRREHVERSLPKQMPLSLYGISTILNNCGISADYVRTYQEQEGAEDIINHLKTGNPIIFEVRQKSNITGKKSHRWTNSYHTMVFLGVLTNGKVMVCDSIDRGWDNNGERIKLVDLSDVMEYMFPCTTFSKSMYYDGASSDGGYIKISAAEN
ncbi:MAG: C39 family peptidase [Eubacteriales bacterium]|nr:C39 family peptidase [Eubacteriales bacterium]